MAAEIGSPSDGKKVPETDERQAEPGAPLPSSQTAEDADVPAVPDAGDETGPATTPIAASATEAEPGTTPEETGADASTDASGVSDSPRSDEPSSHAPPPASGSAGISGMTSFLVAGLVGGIIALAIGIGLQAMGLLPAPGRSEAQQALAEAGKTSDAVAGIDQRITALEAASSQAIADRALLDDLSKKVDSIDGLTKALGDRLLNAETAIAALKDDATGPGGVSTKEMLSSLSKRVMRLETAPPPDGGTDDDTQQAIDSLSNRVTQLESAAPATTAASETPAGEASPDASTPGSAGTAATSPTTPAAPLVSSTPASSPAADDQAASTAALEAFRRAASAGEPFTDALEGLGSIGPPAAIAALQPLAEKGVPSRADLIGEFPKVADAILAADTAAGEDAGFLDRIAEFGRSLVKVRPVNAPAEDPTAAIVATMRTALASGDLKAALAARDGLPAPGLAASQAWADAVADRLAIDKLADEVAPSDIGNGSGNGNGNGNG